MQNTAVPATPEVSAAPVFRVATVDLTTYQQFAATQATLYVLFGVDVQNALQAQQSLQTLLTIAADAKAVFSTIGTVVGAINAIVTIGRFLGFLAPATDEVAAVNANVLETAASLSMQNLQGYVDADWSLSKTGIQFVDENGPLDWADQDTLNAMNNLLSARDWTRAIIGSGNDSFTDGSNMFAPVSLDGRTVAAPGTYGPYAAGTLTFDPNGNFWNTNEMTWKQAIKGGSFTAPNMDGNTTPLQTFDWRLGAPFALKALANRLLTIGALDPWFTTDGYFNGELSNDYTALTNLYNQMNNGVQCGSRDYLFYQGAVNNSVYPPEQPQAQACAIVCADIYTGFAVTSAITPTFPLTFDNHYYNGSWTKVNTTANCETVQGTSTYIDAVNKTAAVIKQEMPLFEMKAAIDSLYRVLNPNPAEDLTAIDGRISPMTEADVCIGGLNQWGQLGAGANLQVLRCDPTDPSQTWSYNRVTGQISNTSNPSLCLEMNGTTAGVPATTQPCATPHASPNDPSGTAGAIEIDNAYQKWTYHPGTGNLINGSGLALGWKATTDNWTLTPAATMDVVSNVWNQGSGWIDPSWDNSMSINGTNYQWRSNSPAFTWPEDLGRASGMSSAPTVAANGDYADQMDLFWTDPSNHLRQAEYQVWNGWTIDPSTAADLGADPAPPGNAPAAVSWAPGRIDLVQNGALHVGCHVWHAWYDSGAWQGWEDLSYALSNQPSIDCSFGTAISSWGQDRLDIFAVNADTGGIGHVAYDASLGGWQAWDDLGIPAVYGDSGRATSTPAAVSWGPNRIDLIVRGGDFNFYHLAYQDGYWYGWENLGGASTAGAAPTITAYQPNRLDIFTVNQSWRMGHLIWDGAWTGWADMGMAVPGSVTSASTNREFMDVFARDTDGTLWHTSAP